jgi:hypothetical protein
MPTIPTQIPNVNSKSFMPRPSGTFLYKCLSFALFLALLRRGGGLGYREAVAAVAALSAPGGARGPITGARAIFRAAVPVSMARRPSEVACCYLRAGGRDRCLNRAAVRDMAAQAGKPRGNVGMNFDS